MGYGKTSGPTVDSGSSDLLVVANYVWDTGALDWVTAVGSVASGTNVTVTNASIAVTGTFWQATQPVSAASLPLPSGASTEATIATLATQTTLSSLLTELQQKVEAVGALTATSGQVSGLGNNTLVTPTAGKKIRLYYANYNPLLAVEAAFRFGAAGTLFLRTNVVANSVIGKDFGDFRYVEGATDEVLILNLSLAVNVIWNAMYVEV